MISVTLFTFLIILSLFAVHKVNQREEFHRERRRHQRRLRWRVDALEELLLGVEETLSDRSIARCLNREILRLLTQMLELETGEKSHLETRIAQAQERGADMEAQQTQPEISRLRENDAQLTRTKDCLDQAARELRRQHAQDRLEAEELERHLQQLSWTKLMVETVTLIAEGHKALKRREFTTSQAYYRRAQGLLISSVDPNPDRRTLISELGEMIQGKREAINPELIPELIPEDEDEDGP